MLEKKYNKRSVCSRAKRVFSTALDRTVKSNDGQIWSLKAIDTSGHFSR